MHAVIDFVKMEGAGNDYVYVDAIRNPFDLDQAPAFAGRVADRHFGVGADGLILLMASEVADVRMRMWNSDGSQGSMCGNGVRCLAKGFPKAFPNGKTVRTANGIRDGKG